MIHSLMLCFTEDWNTLL